MFNCESCGRVTRSNEKCEQIITKERLVIYNDGSEGHEIVEEASMCPRCAKTYKQYYLKGS